MKSQNDSDDKTPDFSERMRSSRFIWSMLSRKYLSEQETNEVNTNVKGFFGTLQDWRDKQARHHD